MLSVDSRLLDAAGEMNLIENFNRVLALVDDLAARVEALEQPENTAEGSGT